MRRGFVPEHRRVLRQGHGDFHDPGRYLHAPLPFCDVARPPACSRRRRARHLAETIAARPWIRRDYQCRPRRPAAAHFVDCINEVKRFAADDDRDPRTRFPRPPGSSLEILDAAPPDVMTTTSKRCPALPQRLGRAGTTRIRFACCRSSSGALGSCKSGLMVGLGETDEEILAVMRDLRAHGVDMLTIGQYLQPSPHHLPVGRYVGPSVFAYFAKEAASLGFRHAAVGALVRSSYHADRQAHQAGSKRHPRRRSCGGSSVRPSAPCPSCPRRRLPRRGARRAWRRTASAQGSLF